VGVASDLLQTDGMQFPMQRDFRSKTHLATETNLRQRLLSSHTRFIYAS